MRLSAGRRDFLSTEMERLDREIVKRKQEIVELDGHRASVHARFLKTHGRVSRIQPATSLAARSSKQTRGSWSPNQTAQGTRSSRSQLKIELETLRQKTPAGFGGSVVRKEKAISLFNANSEALYDAPGNLIIEVGKKRLPL